MVTNSRRKQRANAIWRRRQCEACKAIFTSREHVDLGASLRVETESNGKKILIPFTRDRLFIDLYSSCKHRATGLEDASALTQTIIDKLLSRTNSGLILRSTIVEACIETLERLDTTAATFYSAYHRLDA